MYSVDGYGGMIADEVRLDAYVRALRQAVKPGSVVADIGTGVGFFAALACQFGARRVYAIEPDDAIQVARSIAADNGYADRIEFIQDMSTRVALPERVDVIVSDLRGVLPLFQHHIPSIADARQRLLAPGGVLIPRRDTLWAAVVEAPELHARCTKPWLARPHGIDMAAGARFVANSWSKRRVSPEQLLLPPRPWATIDYSKVTEPDVSGALEWVVERPGLGAGVLVWFDALLGDGAGFSNAPGKPEAIYGTAFFPWRESVALEPGDTVAVALHADLVADDYVWRWDARIAAPESPSRTKAAFRQSSFFGVPLSPDKLRQLSAEHVPTLRDDGQVDAFMLSLMNGTNSLAVIAEQAFARFPRQFANKREPLTRAGKLSEKYGHAPGAGTDLPTKL
jgi:protein arginine N-methyltransferase 1